LSNFIQHAEAAVQQVKSSFQDFSRNEFELFFQATTKSEQQELANRYQLKVSMKKRVQW
jgi:hypothetical protein